MTQFERKIDRKLILSIIAAGIMSFSGVVVETAMNVTFPTLMAEFDVGTSTVQWITTGYLLVLAVIIPASSWLKRRFRTRTLFLAANILFIAGTLLCACAPAFFLLLLGRLIQGVGTGLALPLMFNIVLEQAPYDKMGVMMGIASLITAVAPAVGPSLGGMIVNLLGWRMIFIVLLPLLILSLVFGLSSIRQISPVQKLSFGWKDYLLLSCGFSAMIFGINLASSFGWISLPVLGLLAVSAAALALFYRRSIYSKTPLIRVQVFRYLPFSLSVMSILLIQFICLGMGFLIPNYSQLVSGEDAFISGCLLLPGCIIGAALSPFSGRLLDRIGARKPILTGNISVIVSAVCFALFLGKSSLLLIACFYVFFALGQGFSVGTTMTNGLSALPQELSSDGNAVINTLQQLAGAIGTAVCSTIVASSQASANNMASGTTAGTVHAFIMLAILSVLMLGCSSGAFISQSHLLTVGTPETRKLQDAGGQSADAYQQMQVATTEQG